MQSYGNFSQLFTQISQAFSSVGYKTHSLELLDPNHMSKEEFIQQIQSLSSEIPFLSTILKYNNLFTLFPQRQLINSFLIQNLVGNQISEEIGVGANAKIFVKTFQNEDFALKTMEKFNISMLEFYIQECVNQYNLIQLNKDCILNFKGQVYISIAGNQASLYIPLELAEYSLYDYIQNNEITLEIYQYFYNFLIDLIVLLHSNNYAHRDIKPQNILFIKGQGWKLGDFGESIKYEQREGLYKIQGTVAFLPEQIRKQINKNKEIRQNLYKNDIYAVICTLVMIKNPQFKSKDLMNYMDTQNLDLDVQNLQQTLNCDNPLQQLRLLGSKIQLNMQIFQENTKNIDTIINCNMFQFLLISYLKQDFFDQNHLNIIDANLIRLQQNQEFDSLKKLQLYLTLFYPFQLHQLKSFNQQSLNHHEIISKSKFFLADEFVKYTYLYTYAVQYPHMNDFIYQEVSMQNVAIILNYIKDSLMIGKFMEAQKLLEILGKFMLNQTNFNSDLLFHYNMFYCLIHGESVSYDKNYIQDYYQYKIIQQEIQQIQQKSFQKKSFDINSYLNSDKVINNKVDMKKLFKPLNIFDLDQQTLNIIFRHIIQCLGFSELTIKEDQFKLVNYIKEQLIKSGFKLQKGFICQIIECIEKLFINYDLFEGLLDLLHYFLNFMRFIDKLMYHHLVSAIQRLIFKLNISIYHIKEGLDLQLVKIQENENIVSYIRYIQIFILRELNIIQYNVIQYQHKTEQQPITLDNLQLFKQILNKLTLRKSTIIYNNKTLFESLIQVAQFLSYIKFQNQQYLSILVTICKCLYENSQQSFEINKENTKSQFDPVLLEYYINCKQYNRITELFNQQKTKEDLKPSQQKLVKHLAEIVLIKQNNLNRINQNYKFLYLQQLSKFTINQKFRYLFDFKQHIYVASTFKQMQKRLNVRNMCLKEQYLRI